MLIIATMTTECAMVRPQATSLPSSLPTDFVSVSSGYVVTESGFYLSIPGARRELIARSNHDLEIQKQLSIMQLERDADAKQMKRDEWCAKYCLWVGISSGLILGGLAGFGIEVLLRH